MEPICYVVGAGDFTDADSIIINSKNSKDMLIAADGGYNSLHNYNIIPPVIIGDFDSLDDTLSQRINSNDFATANTNITIQKLNPIKDITDMYACVNYGIENGYKTFYLFGAGGKRLDHTLANVQLMADLATKGYTVKMFDSQNILTVIHNSEIHFDESNKGIISVFSLCDNSHGVYEKGLKYTLNDATLTNTFAIGVSNEFINQKSSIRVNDGTLLIITER